MKYSCKLQERAAKCIFFRNFFSDATLVSDIGTDIYYHCVVIL